MSNSIIANQSTLDQAIALAGLRPGTGIQPASQGTTFPKPLQLPSTQAGSSSTANLQIVTQLLQVVSTVLSLIKEVLGSGSARPAVSQPLGQGIFGASQGTAGLSEPGALPRPSFSTSSPFTQQPSFSSPVQMTPPRSEFEESIREFAGILSAIEQTAPLIPDAVESVSDAGVETWDLFFGPDEEESATVQ